MRLDQIDLEADHEIKLPTFKSQDLTLDTPAKSVGNSDRDLKIGGKITSDLLILFVFEEPLARSVFS